MMKPMAKPKPADAPVMSPILPAMITMLCERSFSVKAPFMLYYGSRNTSFSWWKPKKYETRL